MGTIGITGSTGFLGSHIVKYLGELGYEVRCITRGEFMNQEWSVLNGLTDVIHCAWCTDKDLQSIEHMEFAEWTCNFFDKCKLRGVRVINIGSSSEYGVKYEPMKEDMLCEPVNAYGIAKLSVTLYAKLLGYNTLRLFSPVGTGGKGFAEMRMKTKKWSSPNFVRDYFTVEYVNRAVERLLHARHLYGEIINVCQGVQLANRFVSQGTKQKGEWYTYKQGQFEPSVWVGDITKMKRLLNL